MNLFGGAEWTNTRLVQECLRGNQPAWSLLVDRYKNLIYAPGRYTGYSPKTLPGVREAIEEERWADVDRYAVLTGAALAAYAEKLDEGIRLIGDASSLGQGG